MNKKVKILQVIDRLHIGGAEQICITLTNLLSSTNFNVGLLLLVEEGPLKIQLNPTISIVNLNRKHHLDVNAIFKCAALLKQYDIVHVHMRHNFKYIKMIHQLFFLKNKIILHDHYGNIDTDVAVPKVFKHILKPNYYIGVSNSLTDWALNKLKLQASSVFLLRNIVKKEIIKDSNNQKKGMVLVGNIKPIKNQLFAIQLMEHVDTTLTLYGAIQDQAYYEKIIEEIERLQLKDKISFKHNCVEIQKELQQYELGLQTAISESGPLVVIEYLAQGLPFLSYKTGEVIKIIKQDMPKAIINSFNKEDWLEQIHNLKIEENRPDYERIYDTYFSEDVFIKECVAIYEKVLN